MKKFLLHLPKNAALASVSLLLVFSPFQLLVAQAQDESARLNTSQTVQQVVSAPTPASQQQGPTPSGASLASNPNPNTNGTNPPAGLNNQDIGCSFSGGAGIAMCLTSVIYIFTVGIGTGFAYVAAYFFDLATQLTLNSGAYVLTFISQGWTTARDIANMAFLFILLYIAFLVIFEADTSGTVHMLTNVVVIALLVNFSFFFTRLVIDAGNIVAIQFYNAINVPSIGATSSLSGVAGNVAGGVTYAASSVGGNWSNTKDLTAGIMGMLNLQGLFGNTSFQAFTTSQTGVTGFMVVFIGTAFLYIAAGIMLWMLTIAFAANGVKFLMRTVVLWFLIIASPLAFVARAVPKFESYYKKWQDALIQHAFYPAVFMFIFLMLSNFSNQLANTGNGGLIGSIFSGVQQGTNSGSSPIGTIGIVVANMSIRLGFVIAVLYIGLEASKRIGVMGAEAANHFGSWVGGKYTGALSGVGRGAGWLAGAGYRRTGGAVANALDERLQRSEWANRTGTLGGVVGYRLRRNVLAPMKETSLGTIASSYKEREDFLKKRKSEMDSNTQGVRDRQAMGRAEAIINANKLAGKPVEEGISAKDLDRIQHVTKTQMETMSGQQIKDLSSVFTESQMKNVKELTNLTEKDKEESEMENENYAKSASLRKAQKQIEILREINAKLGTVPALSGKIGVGSRVGSAEVKDIKNILDTQMEIADKTYETARLVRDADGMTKAAAERRIVREGLDATKELETKAKEIRPDVGGLADAGAFKTK